MNRFGHSISYDDFLLFCDKEKHFIWLCSMLLQLKSAKSVRFFLQTNFAFHVFMFQTVWTEKRCNNCTFNCKKMQLIEWLTFRNYSIRRSPKLFASSRGSWKEAGKRVYGWAKKLKTFSSLKPVKRLCAKYKEVIIQLIVPRLQDHLQRRI